MVNFLAGFTLHIILSFACKDLLFLGLFEFKYRLANARSMQSFIHYLECFLDIFFYLGILTNLLQFISFHYYYFKAKYLNTIILCLHN